MELVIKSATTQAIIKILTKIQLNHKLSAYEEFGIRVAIKKLKSERQAIERVEEVKKYASPLPWRIDRMNDNGIDVVDASGNIVYTEDFRSFPDEMPSNLIEQIIIQARANAMLIVLWSEKQESDRIEKDAQNNKD